MTEKEAAILLRIEQPGDSEQMELAKFLGARALEKRASTFTMPLCGHCGHYIPGVSIHRSEECSIPVNPRSDIIMARAVVPMRCPRCRTPFVRVDIDPAERVCVLKGEVQADATARDNLVTAIFADLDEMMLDGAIGGTYPAKVINPEKYAEIKQKYLKGDTNT